MFSLLPTVKNRPFRDKLLFAFLMTSYICLVLTDCGITIMLQIYCWSRNASKIKLMSLISRTFGPIVMVECLIVWLHCLHQWAMIAQCRLIFRTEVWGLLLDNTIPRPQCITYSKWRYYHTQGLHTTVSRTLDGQQSLCRTGRYFH